MMRYLVNSISALGAYILDSINSVGTFTKLFLSVLGQSLMVFERPHLVSQQVHFIGNHSMLIISVSGLFVGLVLGFQGYSTLSMYGSEEALGLLVALSLLRELGPVVTALLFAGRAGTSITAEIGLMKSGEQIAAMDVMGINPLRRIVVPRFWGGVIAMPVLAAIFSAVGVIGGWVVGVLLIDVDNGTFWSQMQNGVDIFTDVGNSIIKSFVFGAAVMMVALYEGWYCRPTPEGVSRATTRTVVRASLLVLGLDFIMTAIMFS